MRGNELICPVCLLAHCKHCKCTNCEYLRAKTQYLRVISTGKIIKPNELVEEDLE